MTSPLKKTNLPNKENIITRKGQALFYQELPINGRRHDLLCLITSYFPMEPTVKERTFTEEIALSENFINILGCILTYWQLTKLDYEWKISIKYESIKAQSNMN